VQENCKVQKLTAKDAKSAKAFHHDGTTSTTYIRVISIVVGLDTAPYHLLFSPFFVVSLWFNSLYSLGALGVLGG